MTTGSTDTAVQMSASSQRLWKLLLAFFVACTVGTFAAWAILLTSFCSNPRIPVPETQHVIPYNCHGMTVFISDFENAMRYWLIPAEVLFIFLTLLAGAMVILSAAKVRVDVQIHVTDASDKSPDR